MRKSKAWGPKGKIPVYVLVKISRAGSTTLDTKIRTMLLIHKIKILSYQGMRALDSVAEARANTTRRYFRLHLRWFPGPGPRYSSGWSAGVFDHPNVNRKTGTRNHLSCNREYSQLRWFRAGLRCTLGWSKTPANHPDVHRRTEAWKPS